jgi:hypothetical protein
LVVNETQNINITDYIYIEDLPYIFETQQLTQSGTYSETYQGLNGCDSTIWLTLSVIDTSIVIDIIPPTLNCNEIDIYLNKDGRYILKPADFKALSEGTTDNVSAPEDIQIDVFRKAFYCKDSGNKIEVKVSATDEAGNEASCFVFLLVQDTFDLSVEQIDDIEVMLAPGVCETSITYPAFVTSNMCAQFTQIAGLGEQGFFPVGITKEEWVLTNRSGDTLSFSFNVIVSSINDLPTIHPVSNTSVHEDSQELQIPLSGISYGIDCEHQEIEVKANGINSDLVTNIAVDYSATDSTAIVILTFAPDMSGSDEITVTVSDSEGESVEESFVVTVIPVNDPPVLVNPIPDFKLNASYPHKIQLTDSPDGFFVDVDNTGLIFKLFKEDGSDLPDWITIENDSLIINPMFADTGCVSLVIKAIDTNGGMTKDTFSICVEGYPTGNTVLETAKFDVQMYPNPTTGEVYLKINTTVILDSEVIVRNIAGSEVLKKEFQAAEMIRIDFSDHVSGIYLVTLKTGDKSVVKKLILNR